MTDEERPSFTVVDRRQSAQKSEEETTNSAGGSPEPEAADAPSDAEMEPTSEEQERFSPNPAMLLSYAAMQMETRDLAVALLAVFDGHAWRGMGLIADPLTGEARKDLPSAQLAIDSVTFLLSKVEGHLADDERREAQRRLNDLRLNYLNKLRES